MVKLINIPNGGFKVKKIIITASVMLFVFAVSVFAGPFGIEFGMTLDQVKQVATIDSIAKNKLYMYFITPNKKSSLIEVYRVNISPKYGVFEVCAFGKYLNSDDYGDKIRSEFDNFVKLIQKNYGEPTAKFDFLRSESIWKEKNEWLTSLRKSERYYTYYWDSKKNNKLIEPLGTINLEIDFEDDYSNNCRIWLTYQTTYYAEALEDARNEENVF